MAVEFVFPHDIQPSDSTTKLVDEMTPVFKPLIAPGPIQRNQRGRARWQVSLRYDRLRQQDRARLLGFLSACRGRLATVWYSPFEYGQRGSFPSSNLIPNYTLDTAANWTTQNPSNVAMTAASRRLRATWVNAAVGSQLYSDSMSVTSGAAYVFRLGARAVRGTFTSQMYGGATSGSISYLGTTITAPGRHIASDVAGSSSYVVSLYELTAGKSADDVFEYEQLDFARCARVNGGSQTGSTLWLKNLPTSTAGLLVVGDYVEVNSQLLRLTADLNSNSSGYGQLAFEPALQSSPADSTPVCIYRPCGRFILADDSEEQNTWGRYLSVNIVLSEVFA